MNARAVRRLDAQYVHANRAGGAVGVPFGGEQWGAGAGVVVGKWLHTSSTNHRSV